jgi:hypothetical protein
MAAGGGPTPEQWEKMSHRERVIYWICVAIVLAILSGLAIKKFFFS